MIAQIRKFKKGDNVLSNLGNARSVYDQAYQTASPALRNNAQALINYANKLQLNHKYTGLAYDKGMVDIYQEATRILQGKANSEPTSNNTWGSTAIADFYAYQDLQRTNSSTEMNYTSTTLPKYSDFTPDYFNNIGLPDEATFLDRIERLINSITTLLSKAKADTDDGITLLLYDKNLYNKTPEIVANLKTIKGSLTNGTIDARLAYNELLKLLEYLTFDLNEWDDYFGTSDDLTDAEKNLKKITQEKKQKKYNPTNDSDPWLNLLDKNHKYQFTVGDDGQVYVWDKDYNSVSDSFMRLHNDGSGNHLVIHNGSLYYGDIFNSLLKNNQDIQNILNEYKEKYREKLGEVKQLDLSNSNIGSDDPLLNDLITYLKNRTTQAKVVNVGHILGSNSPIYAFTETNDLPLDKYGRLDFRKVKLITYDGNLATVGTLPNMLNKGLVKKENINFLPDVDPGLVPTAYSYNNIFSNQDGQLDTTKSIGTRKSDNLKSLAAGLIGTFAGGPVGGLFAGVATKFLTTQTRKAISNDPGLFVNLVVQAIKHPNSMIDIPGADSMTGNLFLQSFGNAKAVINTAGQYVESGQVRINDADFNLLKRVYLDFYKTSNGQQEAITYFKSGGIVKAELGTSAPSSNWAYLRNSNKSISELHKAELAAKEAGYETLNVAEADRSTDLTTSDYMRFATMAADVSSIVASFVPGIGTGVAAGMGVVSMGTDLVADVLDPAVSTGQVVKNLGMNAAFAATGLIPGAKMHKVTANLIKWAPKIVTAISALGIATDESTQLTLKKISDGNLKLTHADWRNLARVLSVVAGGTRMVKGGIDNAKLKHSIAAADNVKLKGVKTADGSDFELPKEKVNEINKALKKAKTPEDVEKIKTKYNDIPDEAFKLPAVNDKGQFEGTASLVEASKSSAGEAMRELWNKEAEIISKLAQENPGWFAFANKFGGGAYSGTLRAILSDPELAKAHGFDVARYLEYKGVYNPMYDHDGIRTKAGMIGAQSKSLKPVEASTPKSTPTPKAEATGKGRNITIKNPLSKEVKQAALKFAKLFGIDIKDQKAYMRFIADLKTKNPDLYRQLLSGRPTINPNRWIPKAKQEYNFRDGGRINSYSHLRK